MNSPARSRPTNRTWGTGGFDMPHREAEEVRWLGRPRRSALRQVTLRLSSSLRGLLAASRVGLGPSATGAAGNLL